MDVAVVGDVVKGWTWWSWRCFPTLKILFCGIQMDQQVNNWRKYGKRVSVAMLNPDPEGAPVSATNAA